MNQVVKRKITKKSLFIFLLILISFYLIHYLDLTDKFLFNISSSKNNFIIDREYSYLFKDIPEIEKNLSGITYNDKSDTLFLITNSPRNIYEMNKNGGILKKIELKGFKDTEDITFMNDDLYAILDEKLSSFFIININEDTKTIHKNDAIKEFNIDVRNFPNFGLEGISYNKYEDIFYIVNERNPKKVLLIQNFMNNAKTKIKLLDELMENNSFLSDFSAIHFDEIEKRFYILSDESLLLGRVDNEKNFNNYLDLNNSISSKLSAPEGITKDNDGNFYIVGEPNHFLRIKFVK